MDFDKGFDGKNRNRNVIRRFLLFTILFLFFVIAVSMTVHAEVTFDGSLGGGTGTMNGPAYDITANWGTVSGDNLFHSFGQFNILTDQTATFSGPDNINNIIGRVTGGASTIDGTLSSTIDGANLYLLNPYGVMFGSNASLDVTGSFHVSTADFIRFADGETFHASPAMESVLSVSPPSAFGFLTCNPSSITVEGSSLEVPEGKTLSIIAGDISLSGPTPDVDFTLSAPGGRIDIVSVASPGEVVPSSPGELPEVDVSSFSDLGEISMVNGAFIDVSGDGGGTVLIRGGRFVMEMTDFGDDTGVNAHNLGDLDAANQAVDIEISGEFLMRGGFIQASSYQMGRAGDIRITAGDMEVGGTYSTGANNLTGIASRAWSTGDGGAVEVNADNLRLTNAGNISTYTEGEGDGGPVTVTVSGDLEVLNNGLIYTNGEHYLLTDPGDTGDLTISAGNILLAGSEGFTGLTSQAHGGNSGNLTIITGDLRIEGAAEVGSATFGVGSGGVLDIDADAIYISGSPFHNTGIFSNTWGPGKGGDLIISSGIIELNDRGGIEAGTFANEEVGSGTGDAGSMTIDTGSLVLRDGSYVAASGFAGAGGDSNDITITATDIMIEGYDSTPHPFSLDVTGIYTSNVDGNCGDIQIDTETLTLNKRGTITTSSHGAGLGGNITIDFVETRILDGSNISAGASGSGPGGSIVLTGGNLVLSGVNSEPFMDITGTTNLATSSIDSQATLEFGGDAGPINIEVDSLHVLDGAQISASTFGPGNGGSIEVTAGDVLLSGWNTDLAEFLADMGKDPTFTASGIFTNTDGSRLGDLATGSAGDISINSQNIMLADRGILFSGSDTPGAGGDINVTVDGTATLSNGRVLADSSGTGDAGNITITAGKSLISDKGLVSTKATQSGGGSIDIEVPYMVYLVDTELTTSVQQGGSDAGNITIDPEFVVLNDSNVIANAFGGAGGNILIVADVFLTDPYSTMNASSTLGIDGEIDIQAPYQYVSEGMALLSEDFTDPITLLRDTCMARATGGRYSSLVVGRRDGVPLAPGRLLPSPLSTGAGDGLFFHIDERVRFLPNPNDQKIPPTLEGQDILDELDNCEFAGWPRYPVDRE